MKIGILTFHRSQNYGALLQAKALQDFVRELGHDVAFIDYWPSYHEEMYKPFSWQKFYRMKNTSKVKYILQFIFTTPRLNKRRKKTNNYINKYLNISQDINYDVVIYGSDQIWRKQHQPTYDWFNPVYWGEGYVKTNNKIAYAASMGQIEIVTCEDKDFVKTHLKNYKAISIREVDLIDFLEQEYGIRYQMVCDPVFLLTKEQWLQHTNPKYIPKKKYILYYRLQNIKETDRMVQKLVKQTGLEVIEMRSYMPFFHYGNRYRLTADAQEFVTLINGAEYVVTSAFHGIAMSIIFEKQFFFTSEKKQSNRVASLLKTLGLEDRFADGYENVVDTAHIINYSSIRVKLQDFADESRRWLINQIGLC